MVSQPSRVPRTLRITAWTVAIGLAALRTIAFRHSMNPDGLSYLDMARAFTTGDLSTALNPHWGPLYPALVALGFTVVKPGIGWVFPLAHAASFFLFLLALAAFDFLLHELLQAREANEGSPPDGRASFVAALFGYGVFIYTALFLIDFRLATPDFGVAASAFAAAGLILRMQRKGPTIAMAMLLGVVLALGYFTKSVMFVLGFAFIGCLVLFPAAGRPRPWRATAVALVVFLALSSLLIVPFSRTTGTPTFGTAGKLAYAWEVNHVPYTNWQGDARSRLVHPPRQVRADPEVFEYSRHLTGTYPPWFDPAYWNAGIVVPVSPVKQVGQLLKSAKFYFNLLVDSAGALATLMVLLSLGVGLRKHLAVLVPGLLGLAIYGPVHVEGRYVAPFLALLWVVPVLAARPRTPNAGRLFGRAASTSALLLIVLVGLDTLSTAAGPGEPAPDTRVASALRGHGIVPGDRVANIGHLRGENFGSSFAAYWAYLAGVHIVAEVPEQQDFICRDAATQDSVFRAFADVGARAVVTRGIPLTACADGWERVLHTDFYLRMLSPGPK